MCRTRLPSGDSTIISTFAGFWTAFISIVRVQRLYLVHVMVSYHTLFLNVVRMKLRPELLFEQIRHIQGMRSTLPDGSNITTTHTSGTVKRSGCKSGLEQKMATCK